MMRVICDEFDDFVVVVGYCCFGGCIYCSYFWLVCWCVGFNVVVWWGVVGCDSWCVVGVVYC